MEYNNKKVYFDKKGYALIWINGKDNKIHILEWEKYNGKKPKGYEIHHKDNNKKNWEIHNLTLETKSDHRKIHAGWIRKNRIWIKKPCKDCKKLLELNEFYQRKGLTPSNRCINCSKKKWLKEARERGVKPKRYILPNKDGKYECPQCEQWKIKDLFKLKNNKPTSYCKDCFNEYQNRRRKLKSVS